MDQPSQTGIISDMKKSRSSNLFAPKRNKATKPQRSRRSGSHQSGGLGGYIGAAFRLLARAVFWVIWRLSKLGIIILAGFVGYYLLILPDAAALMDDRKNGSVTMLDYRGDIFAWRGDQFGGIVTPDTISPNLRNAVIATEDKRFYSHFGISLRGIAGAIRTNLREGRSPLRGHGGSTITQQVAKQLYFSQLPSWERKLREVPMAFAMELKYTKDEILTIYLNRVYLGNGTFGFAAASQRYFGQSVSAVSPAQAAMLAGLLKAPSTINPIRNFDRAYARANLIIGLMQDQGYLTASAAQDARENPARLSQAAAKKAGGYFADWILESAPEFIIKDANADVIITTTFDPMVQDGAEQALARSFAKLKSSSRAQAAIVVMSRDGAVRAMVGGRKNEFAGAFNRATQALRQTGSAFKPFVYAAALENGMRYNDIIDDAPITIQLAGQPDYSPQNYDKRYLGPISLTQALAQSRNTSAVAISEQVGRARVRAVAHDFGIRNDIPSGPALALGAGESTLLDMVGAYAGIANRGQAVTPYGLVKLTIQGDSEPLLQKENRLGQRVINDYAARQLIHMLRQTIQSGTGQRAFLPDGRDAAGKTGTTQGARDAWFIGFTADYVAGVWMGYDDNTPLTGVTGGGLPAEIWRETMVAIHAGLPLRPLAGGQFDDQLIGVPLNPSGEISVEEQIIRDVRSAQSGLGQSIRRLFDSIFN